MSTALTLASVGTAGGALTGLLGSLSIVWRANRKLNQILERTETVPSLVGSVAALGARLDSVTATADRHATIAVEQAHALGVIDARLDQLVIDVDAAHTTLRDHAHRLPQETP